jgi:hypothetical protein
MHETTRLTEHEEDIGWPPKAYPHNFIVIDPLSDLRKTVRRIKGHEHDDPVSDCWKCKRLQRELEKVVQDTTGASFHNQGKGED